MDKKKSEQIKGGLNSLFAPNQQRKDEIAETTQIIEEHLAGSESQQDILEQIDDESLREALRKRRSEHKGRPKKGAAFVSQSESYQRITLIAHKEKMDKLREISLRESLTIKEVVEMAFDMAIERYEEKHGEIKPSKAKETHPANPFK